MIHDDQGCSRCDFPSERHHEIKGPYLLEALANAKSIKERLSALDLALLVFNHSDTLSHNHICQAGGITLVAHCLQLQMQQSGLVSICELQMIDSLCRLLVFMFRCSSHNGSIAFQSIGSDLVSMLVSIVYENPGNNELGSSIKTLCNRLAELEHVSILDTDKSKLLTRLLQQLLKDEYEMPCLTHMGSRLIRGLTKQPGNKALIGNQPALVDDLVSLLLRSTVSEVVKYDVTEILKNLSWVWSLKMVLAGKKRVLQGLQNILRRKWQDGELKLKACLSVIETIRLLSSEASCRAWICSYSNGSIMKALSNAMQSQELHAVSADAILRLIDPVTAPGLLKKHPQLVKCLAVSATPVVEQPFVENCMGYYGKNASKQCVIFDSNNSANNATVMSSGKGQRGRGAFTAASSLYRLARHVTINDKSHPFLMEALTKLASSNDTKSRLCAAKGLREQSRTSAGRFYMVRTPQAVDTLVVLANDSCRAVQSSATEALLWFASDSLNAKRLTRRADVLETFVRNGKKAAECLITCRSAIQAIIAIVSYESSLPRIAKTLELVEVLSHYGISDDIDVALKSASLQCVIMLAPLM